MNTSIKHSKRGPPSRYHFAPQSASLQPKKGALLLCVETPHKDKVLTATADNGKEFSAHARMTDRLGVAAYFAKSYHSWERGLNEHTNGLLRQYLHKARKFDPDTSRT